MGQSLADRIREAIRAQTEAAARGVDLGGFLELRVGEVEARTILETLEEIERAQEAVRGGDRLLHLASVMDGKALVLPELGLSGSETPSTAAREVVDAAVFSLGSALALASAETSPLEELEEARSFFERPLGHPEDKALIASVVSAALPSPDADQPRAGTDAFTAAVDTALHAAKAAHKAFVGEIGATDAASWWLDRVVASIEVIVDRATRWALERGGQAIGAAVGRLVGLGPLAAQIGGTLGRMAGREVARPLARACGEFARRILPRVGSAVRAWVEGATAKANAWIGR